MEELYDQQILSVFVEGGARLIESFLESGLWDEARVFTGKMCFGQGVKAPEPGTEPVERLRLRETVVEVFMNHFGKFYNN